MKRKMVLPNGIKIIMGDETTCVFSSDGKKVYFDNKGRLLQKKVFNKPVDFIKYFDFMGEKEQKIAKEWYEKRISLNIGEDSDDKRRKLFFQVLAGNVAKIEEEYYIANMEPSCAKGRICYVPDKEVATEHSAYDWQIMAHEFAPQFGSKLATVSQLVLWYAYRIAMGYWTIEDVFDKFLRIGDSENKPKTSNGLELSGAIEFGGARDGVANTGKLVTSNDEKIFVAFGEKCSSFTRVTDYLHISLPNEPLRACVGVVALNEVDDIKKYSQTRH